MMQLPPGGLCRTGGFCTVGVRQSAGLPGPHAGACLAVTPVMTRKQTKIKLARETVRSLSATQLDGARGGLNTMGDNCSTVRNTHCPCQSDHFCFSDYCNTVGCEL